VELYEALRNLPDPDRVYGNRLPRSDCVTASFQKLVINLDALLGEDWEDEEQTKQSDENVDALQPSLMTMDDVFAVIESLLKTDQFDLLTDLVDAGAFY
jgi:hypothetical protein